MKGGGEEVEGDVLKKLEEIKKELQDIRSILEPKEVTLNISGEEARIIVPQMGLLNQEK